MTNPYARPGTTGALALALAAVLTAAAPGWGEHIIAPGETLAGIAERYGTSVAVLVEANNLPGRGDLIHAGATLAVPTAAPVLESSAHTVAVGESLSVIAAAHGVSVQALRAANDVGPGDLIVVGQVLSVPALATAPNPAAPSAPATPASELTHQVTAGETVSELAVRYDVSVAEIRDLNELDMASRIRIGQELRLPASATTQATGGNTFAGRTYSDEVVAAADRNRAELATRAVPSREQVRALIVATAEEHGVDPNLALAISYQESGFNHRAVSVANAVGAMQVLPGTAQWMSNVLGRPLDVLDPQDNVTAGVVLLMVLGRVAESEEQAIGAYYQGLQSMRENGPAADTVQYIANVQALKGRFATG